ncbi:MAG: FAD-binding and (Fe-S)-binding domain-containing protein [Verrucomicrobia bacterium]|nr:FAD-binding and (Fe-S)-binding domain-containing protein [Verrucomicrobiota bacterium]
MPSALAGRIEGEVRFEPGDQALYATDGSNYRQTPIGVVIPRSKQDVIETVRICHAYGAPITSRGCGTSLAGQCCNTAVIIDNSKYYNQVIAIDAERRLARVQPGCILDVLRDAAMQHGLTFGPDPSTHSHCTLGGMLGNDSCGVHSVMAAFEGTGARVADNTEALEILTYDGLRMTVGPTSEAELEQIIGEGGRRGQIYSDLRALRDRYADLIREKFPNIPRRVSGYNLPQLLPENGFNLARALVGSEGTCVTILEATLNLIHNPGARALVVLGYPDVYSAGDHCPEVMQHRPIGLEGIDDLLISYMKKTGIHPEDITLLPEGKGWLLVEFGGDTREEAEQKARNLMEALQGKPNPPSMKLFTNPDEERKLWEVRESGLGATAFVPGEPSAWPGWEDSAVPPEKVGPYLRDLRALFDKFGYTPSIYGHFGQGCIHCRIPFDVETDAGLKKYRAFVEEAADLVIRYGGSLSGEHGDGQARAELLPKMFGEELIEAFREFKAIWDPQNKMNPGKVSDPSPILSNLRLGANYNPWNPDTHFQFPQDAGSMAKAALRCVGVGTCRRLDGGTMCPSFMVTREELDTTRGRAHLLFEMFRGETIGKHGWKDESVKRALDLCLACKGCKSDCPLHVDMATYKAEFLSHYYAGRLRPRAAYSMGLIYWWARLASLLPGVVNFFTQTEPFATAVKQLGGIAPQRKMPLFAKETFKTWFHARGLRNLGQPRVILWADTFNNHFLPETAKAAVEVLEAARFQVVVPQKPLCCGRPLYDWGMLTLAKRSLRQILDALREEIRAGTPVVGLEPSCVAVFRDELINLFPNDEDAQRLSRQTWLLSEFLNKQAADFQIPKLERKAVLHGHCHHKAVAKMTDEKAILEKLGMSVEAPETGCCGMAGSFGFEQENYDISVRCGDRVLFPAVRNADKQTVIVADGFSCREQIEGSTDRKGLHLAQVLQMALRKTPTQSYPECHSPQDPKPISALAAAAFTLAAAGLLAWVFKPRRRA